LHDFGQGLVVGTGHERFFALFQRFALFAKFCQLGCNGSSHENVLNQLKPGFYINEYPGIFNIKYPDYSAISLD
jgi:hypothetical protein